jgi:1-acyl-sn-glycerol-3-phosphate acyltransferase
VVASSRLKTLRYVVNSIFFGLWTAFMVTYAVSMGALTGDPERFRREQRRWAAGLLRFWGVKLEVYGAEHMPTGTSYVVISNHLSYVDIVALFLALPITPGFMAKKELTRIPFLATALKAGGHVLIDRKKHASALQTLQDAALQVREGKTVLIFPEGTRGDSDTVGKFKKGGFHLVKDAGVPLLPVGVRGARAIFPRNSLLVRSGKLEVHIGPAIPPEEVAQLDSDVLMERTRAIIVELSAMPPRERDAPA